MPCESLCRRFRLRPRVAKFLQFSRILSRKRVHGFLIKLRKFSRVLLSRHTWATVPTLILVILAAFTALSVFSTRRYSDGRQEIHDACGVPWSLVRIICRAYMSTKPGVTGDPIALIKLAACDHTSASRMMVVEPMNGLANRLRTLASAAALSRRHGRHLLVIWRTDVHCGARFRALFELSRDTPILAVFDVAGAVTEPMRTDSEDTVDHAWRRWAVHDTMQKTLLLRQRAALLNMTGERRHLYVRSSSVLNPEPAVPWRVANAELARLRPARAVGDRAASLTLRLKHSVCLHIRHVPLSDDVAGIAQSEYGAVDAAITSFWRNVSAPSVFATEAARLIHGNVQLREVFVAADRSEWIDEMRDRLAGLAAVWSLLDVNDASAKHDSGCESRSEHCVENALVDLLCLSRCAVLIGSPWSSFTEVAARLRGERVRLAGIDFAQVSAASLGGVSAAVRHAILQTVSKKADKSKRSRKVKRGQKLERL